MDDLNEYVKDIEKYPLLTQEEEIKYAKLYQQSKDLKIKDILITHNLHLVIKIVNEYKYSTVPLLGLIQEGNLGLIRAIETYDPSKGRLSTYATPWIKRYIYNCSTDNSVIKCNTSIRQIVNLFRKIETECNQNDLPLLPRKEICQKIYEQIQPTKNFL